MKARQPKGMSRLAARIILELREFVHPVTIADLCGRLQPPKGTSRKRASALVSVTIRHLRDRGCVWSPLEGYLTHKDGWDFKRFLEWISVLSDKVDDCVGEKDSRTIEILAKFCCAYKHGVPEHEEGDKELFREVALRVYLALLNSGEDFQTSKTGENLALVDRAIVGGLEGNKWISSSDLQILLPEIVDYGKRTAFVPGRENSHYGRRLTVRFIVQLAHQWGLDTYWNFKKMAEAGDESTLSRWRSMTEKERTEGSLEWGSYVTFEEERDD